MGTADNIIDQYDPEIIAAQDYYPFGMQMPGREAPTTNGYRYCFNGKEEDDEVKGDGNQQDYGMRIYDPRAGRFLSVDPLARKFPWWTPYQFAGNMPIRYVDLDGLEPANNPQSPGLAEVAGMAIVQTISVGATGNNFLENKTNIPATPPMSPQELKGTLVETCDDKYVTDTPGDPGNLHNMYVSKSSVFKVDESNSNQMKNYEAFVVDELMRNMATGKGPENYEFPTNGVISSQFLDSDILKKALTDYKSGSEVNNVQYSFGATELLNDTKRNGSIFNITGLTGSGMITITPTEGFIKVKIFNITSLTSGTLGKEGFDEENWPTSYSRESGKATTFGNISQTFNLRIPVSQIDRIIEKP